jgi:hypothetical protein
MTRCTHGHIFEALGPQFLSPFNRGNQVTGDRHGIVIGFPEINVHALTVFTLP